MIRITHKQGKFIAIYFNCKKCGKPLLIDNIYRLIGLDQKCLERKEKNNAKNN